MPEYSLNAYYFYDKETIIRIELRCDPIEINREEVSVKIPEEVKNDFETVVKSLIDLR
ncbi:hypothetical protein [Maledivibacter halophilus]|uniref:hypothetical protein n=1 Tax=Maledivibacter halophilus TaxID=36842 RepID=UPI001AD8E803|nr:hypothetical protein [Maledivibacter halophilus]